MQSCKMPGLPANSAQEKNACTEYVIEYRKLYSITYFIFIHKKILLAEKKFYFKQLLLP